MKLHGLSMHINNTWDLSLLTGSVKSLLFFLDDSLHKSIEKTRIARAVYAIYIAGSSSADLIRHAVNLLRNKRIPDGGWTDPEETAWAISCILQICRENDRDVLPALKWLQSARLYPGGWGRHPRDQARIPITALIAALVPTAFKQEDLNWLRSEWARDFSGPVRLSYKAGFYLLAMPLDTKDELVELTIAHLTQDQNDDGGFAPWKNHPIGSDPWSTGVVLWGLSRWVEHADRRVLERALEWLAKTQLPSGYWPYHYLDEGTSLALIGAVNAMKALAQ